MTEPADRPARPTDHRDRRVYVLWGVGFGLLGLLGAVLFIFGPPQVWHSIWVLRHNIDRRQSDMGSYEHLKHLDICTDAACRGNNLAMDAVMTQWAVTHMSNYYARLAMGRPDDFVRYLERQDDDWLTFRLPYTALGLQGIDRTVAGQIVRTPGNPGNTGLALERLCRSQRPEVAKAARTLLDFINRRYPGDVEEEKKTCGPDAEE